MNSFVNTADVNPKLINAPWLLGAICCCMSNRFPENNQAECKPTKAEVNRAGLGLI